MTPNRLGALIAAVAVIVAAGVVTAALIVTHRREPAAAPPGPAAVETHQVTLRAQGDMYIDVFDADGTSHRAPQTRYTSTVTVTGPVADSGISVSAAGPTASCSIDVDGVPSVSASVKPGDKLLLAYCQGR